MAGAIALAYALAGLFFLRFWMKSRDRLFALFALAFWILTVERLVLISAREAHDFLPYVYVIRLVAFLTILGAVLDKNRRPN
jgi:hypothetical protein